jgi:pyruvate-ferredoxin/flavodoxin oxidoreductase
MKRYMAKKNIKFYVVNAVEIAKQLGLGGRFNMIMQSAFFKLANIIPIDTAVGYLKDAVVKSYGNKGQNIVDMNHGAIDKGLEALVQIEIPASWAEATDDDSNAKKVPAFIKNILEPMNRQEGDALPVSAFAGMEDGTFPLGTAAYEKRGIAINVPEWQVENCIQCNQCSYVCPHATIRPFLLNEEEAAAAPEGFAMKPAVGVKDGSKYHIGISPLDCVGCGNCAQVCPAKEKALIMKPIDTQLSKVTNWEYAMKVSPKQNPVNKMTVKGSQFEKPLLEFSGACAGCGETPYAKLVTQLFGDRMMVSNATGCSSIWGGSAPSIPYTTNHKGHGPAWANSLFEDNAEFGLGMFLGTKAVRNGLADDIKAVIETAGVSEALKAACSEWLAKIEDGVDTRDRADKIIALLETEKGDNALLNKIYDNKDFLVKRSQWIFGGDGWAYDIGYGGLDHVLASGEDVNVLVFDTEVYSNTGGQSSKSTPAAAIAQFAATGKKTKKKDLGMMAMSYGYVYVAQIAMGADKNQALKAIAEAESYKGPSLIIAYAPCINHGLRVGMGSSQLETKRAVESGYWSMYRFNPELKGTDKNPFTLDSKEPTLDFKDFLMGEVRYSSLKRQYPETADALFEKTEQDAKERRESYEKLAGK